MARTAGSKGDVTGPRIFAAAERLIAEQGYAAVSMRAIAKEVGLQVQQADNLVVVITEEVVMAAMVVAASSLGGGTSH